MQLLETFKKSVYSPEFYRGLHQRPLSFSFKYFLSIVIVFSLVLTFLGSINLIPAANHFVNEISPGLLEIYPSDLVVTIKGGEVSTNTQEPYYMIFPESAKRALGREDTTTFPKHLVAIDTQNPAAIDNFASYDALLLLTKSKVIIGDAADYQVIKIDEATNFTITKHTLSLFLSKITRLSKWLSPLIVFGVFGFTFLRFSFFLTYLALISLVAFLISKVKNSNLSYRRSFQAALHASSLALLIEFLSFFLLPPVPFLFFFLTLLVLWLNLFARNRATA